MCDDVGVWVVECGGTGVGVGEPVEEGEWERVPSGVRVLEREAEAERE